MAKIEMSEDAHSRVAVLFEMPMKEGETQLTLVCVSVKWLIVHGAPKDPETNEYLKYHGTHIIQ